MKAVACESYSHDECIVIHEGADCSLCTALEEEEEKDGTVEELQDRVNMLESFIEGKGLEVPD